MADSPHPPRTVSNPEMLKVQSAARARPLPAQKQALTKERLKAGAADTALNVASILREVWEDFRNSDRFFKYKAGIIALWAALSVSGFVVACPSSAEHANSIGAQLVIAGDATEPIYMVRNRSDATWRGVVVVVNGRFRKATGDVAPSGTFTLSPNLLVGPDGRPAPRQLAVKDLEVQTEDGATRLLEGGQPK